MKWIFNFSLKFFLLPSKDRTFSRRKEATESDFSQEFMSKYNYFKANILPLTNGFNLFSLISQAL